MFCLFSIAAAFNTKSAEVAVKEGKSLKDIGDFCQMRPVGELINDVFVSYIDYKDKQLTDIIGISDKFVIRVTYKDDSAHHSHARPITRENIELNISGNHLSNLSDEITWLKLYILNASGNQLTTIPAYLAGIDLLRKLNLSHNKITEVEDGALYDLENLEELDLSHNQLTELPQAISQMYNLKRLILSYNKIKELPAWITQLTKLEELFLDNNELSELPASLNVLIKLSRLDLQHNRIKQLPTKIGQLPMLTRLNLSHNSLIDVPDSLGNLKQLNILSLAHNQLESLPFPLSNLSNLNLLYLSGNKFSILDRSVGAILELRLLDLSHNAFELLPPELEQGGHTSIPKVAYLNLSHNRLVTLPKWVVGSEVDSLDVSHNRLTSLPRELGEPNNIELLDVSHNELMTERMNFAVLSPEQLEEAMKKFSSFLFPLRMAKKINISHNKLQIFFINDEVSNAEEIDLSHNPLEQLPCYAPKLDKLKKLSLRFTQLRSLPDWLYFLPSLRDLDVSNNLLVCLPECTIPVKSSALTTLDVSNNHLGALPVVLIELKKSLQTLKIFGNEHLLTKIREIFSRENGNVVVSTIRYKDAAVAQQDQDKVSDWLTSLHRLHKEDENHAVGLHYYDFMKNKIEEMVRKNKVEEADGSKRINLSSLFNLVNEQINRYINEHR